MYIVRVWQKKVGNLLSPPSFALTISLTLNPTYHWRKGFNCGESSKKTVQFYSIYQMATSLAILTIWDTVGDLEVVLKKNNNQKNPWISKVRYFLVYH